MCPPQHKLKLPSTYEGLITPSRLLINCGYDPVESTGVLVGSGGVRKGSVRTDELQWGLQIFRWGPKGSGDVQWGRVTCSGVWWDPVGLVWYFDVPVRYCLSPYPQNELTLWGAVIVALTLCKLTMIALGSNRDTKF